MYVLLTTRPLLSVFLVIKVKYFLFLYVPAKFNKNSLTRPSFCLSECICFTETLVFLSRQHRSLERSSRALRPSWSKTWAPLTSTVWPQAPSSQENGWRAGSSSKQITERPSLQAMKLYSYNLLTAPTMAPTSAESATRSAPWQRSTIWPSTVSTAVWRTVSHSVYTFIVCTSCEQTARITWPFWGRGQRHQASGWRWSAKWTLSQQQTSAGRSTTTRRTSVPPSTSSRGWRWRTLETTPALPEIRWPWRKTLQFLI